jgi:hypothetical protein
MSPTKLLLLSITLLAFLSGMFFCALPANRVSNDYGHAVLQQSNQNVFGHLDWVEEIEFGEEDNFLDLGLPHFSASWVLITHVLKDKLQLVILSFLFALFFHMKGNSPFIYLMDCVFRI